MSEPALFSDLRRVQRALAKAEAGLPRNNKRERAPLEAAVEKLKKLVVLYSNAVRERIQLDNRNGLLASSIDVLELEEAWSRRSTPLCLINETRAPSPSDVVSFMGMPHPNTWDDEWLDRIKLLTSVGERRRGWHWLGSCT